MSREDSVKLTSGPNIDGAESSSSSGTPGLPRFLHRFLWKNNSQKAWKAHFSRAWILRYSCPVVEVGKDVMTESESEDILIPEESVIQEEIAEESRPASVSARMWESQDNTWIFWGVRKSSHLSWRATISTSWRSRGILCYDEWCLETLPPIEVNAKRNSESSQEEMSVVIDQLEVCDSLFLPHHPWLTRRQNIY